MNKTTLIFKGILLWITIISIIFAIGIVDFLVEARFYYTFITIIALIFLIGLCHKVLSSNDLYTLSGAKFLDNLTDKLHK